MYVPIFDELVGLLLYGSGRTAMAGRKQALVATLMELDHGLTSALVDGKVDRNDNPVLRNAASAFFSHVRANRSDRLELLAIELEHLLGAQQNGEASKLQSEHLRAAVRGQLALLS